jgi:hypothetical protein
MPGTRPWAPGLLNWWERNLRLCPDVEAMLNSGCEDGSRCLTECTDRFTVLLAERGDCHSGCGLRTISKTVVRQEMARAITSLWKGTNQRDSSHSGKNLLRTLTGE